MQRLVSSVFFILGAIAPLAHGADKGASDPTFTVGAGIALVPEYTGGEKREVVGVVSLDYQNANGFFASTRRGIGYQAKDGAFSYSAAVGYEMGRHDHDSTHGRGSDFLRGMGHIKGSAVALIGGGYEIGDATLSAKAAMALTNRERGNHYEFGASMRLVANEKNRVSAFANADYGDSKYNQTFYGVTAAQSKSSLLPKHNVDAGFSKVALGMNWRHQINKAWSVNSTAGGMRLVGDAADSPLTQRKATPFLLSTVNYAF